MLKYIITIFLITFAPAIASDKPLLDLFEQHINDPQRKAREDVIREKLSRPPPTRPVQEDYRESDYYKELAGRPAAEIRPPTFAERFQQVAPTIYLASFLIFCMVLMVWRGWLRKLNELQRYLRTPIHPEE
jgi:hypothetical protein